MASPKKRIPLNAPQAGLNNAFSQLQLDGLPEGLAVQPVASREPLVLGAELRAAGFQPRPEQPAPLLRQLAAAQAEQPVGLLVIDRPVAAALPVALGELLPRTARLLVPAGLVTPAEGGPLAELAGWQLFDAVRFSG